jgi:hypothetical protein
MVEHDDIGARVGESLTMHLTSAATSTGNQDNLA